MSDPQTHFQTVSAMIEHLRSEDRESRLLSSRGLLLIAHTLGPERTRGELIPYVTEYFDDDDEVLCVTAQNLGRMLNEVGGPSHVAVLLQPLMQLSQMEEVTVRMETAGAMCNIAEQIFRNPAAAAGGGASGGAGSLADSQAAYCSAVLELSASELPQSRATAASLFEVPLRCGSPAQKRDIRAAFSRLCEDSEVMVRRAACVALGTEGMARALHAYSPDVLVPCLTRFAKDTAEGVKLQSVPAAVALIPLVGDAAFSAVKNLSTDPGWRVRFMVADRIGALCGALAAAGASSAAQQPQASGTAAAAQSSVVKLGVPLFRSLLIDQAPEIRASAVFNLDTVLSHVPSDDAKKDATVAACKLTTDTSPHVRQCVADVLLKTVAHTSRILWDAHIIPACTSLLRDEDPQVRLGIVRSFASAAAAAENSASSTTAQPSSNGNPLDSLQSVAQALVPTVVVLAKDPNWRVRELVLKQAAAVIQCLRARSQDELLSACIGALTDRVATIRQAAVESLKRLTEINGGPFVSAQIMGQAAAQLASSPNYSQRVTWVQLLGVAAAACSDKQVVANQVWPALVKAANDKVPNVRMTAARVVRQQLGSGIVSDREVEALVKKLEMDQDVDVRDALRPPQPPVGDATAAVRQD